MALIKESQNLISIESNTMTVLICCDCRSVTKNIDPGLKILFSPQTDIKENV
jgi:hypothetical protein